MPKLNQGGGGGQVPGKGLVPDAPPFNKQAHDREHFPQAAGGFGESLMVIGADTAVLNVGNSYTAFADFSTAITVVWDDGFTRSTGGIQIPSSLGGIYLITCEFEVPGDVGLLLNAYALYSNLDPVNDIPTIGPIEICGTDNFASLGTGTRTQLTMSGIWYMPETWWISLQFQTNSVTTGSAPTTDRFSVTRIGGIPDNINSAEYT